MKNARLSLRRSLSMMPILLAGCVSPNTPSDLALISVRAVDWHDQHEMPGPGASPVLGMVNSRVLALSGQSVSGGEKPHRPLLKIEFTSATNLSQFVTEHSYNLGNTAFLCKRPEDRVTLSFSYIFWRGIRLGLREADPIRQRGEVVEAPITYYIFIDVADKERPQDIPPQKGFDLREKPEDVCFYLSGGNNWGRGYKSNVLIVPKSAIAASLNKG